MDKYEKAEMLTMSCEGTKLVAYRDDAGIITIATGLARTYLDGTPICDGDTCTLLQAKEWLHEYMQREVYPRLDHIIAKSDVPENIYAALSCFAYNVGYRMFRDHDLLEALGNGDWQSLAAIMRTYNKIHKNGVEEICPGLTSRRNKEISFFLNEDGSLK